MDEISSRGKNMNLGRFEGLFERFQGHWWKRFVIWREWRG
jgi:hypothetical protein